MENKKLTGREKYKARVDVIKFFDEAARQFDLQSRVEKELSGNYLNSKQKIYEVKK